MDLSSLMQMGVGMLQDKGISADSDTMSSALNQLIGDGDSMDIGSLVSSFTEGGLGDIVGSWLGGGDNAAVSPNALMDMLGSDKIAAFASQLGISEDSALDSLSGALPQMVDNASAEGSILDSIGGADGAMKMIGKMFG